MNNAVDILLFLLYSNHTDWLMLIFISKNKIISSGGTLKIISSNTFISKIRKLRV